MILLLNEHTLRKALDEKDERCFDDASGNCLFLIIPIKISSDLFEIQIVTRIAIRCSTLGCVPLFTRHALLDARYSSKILNQILN